MRFFNKIMLLAVVAGTVSTGALAETLRVGLQDDPDSLDPATGGTYAGRIVFAALCDKLVDIDANLKIVPQLATEWSWNEDRTALTMKLREGVTFHDGTPFDAEAVKANIERMQTMGESKRKGELSPISSVEVVDPTTVVLHLEQPFAPLLSILTDRAGMMVSPAAATSADAFAANPSCSGPYQFVSRQARDTIKLTKYADYWNADQIFYDDVEYRIVPDATVRLARLQAGDLEVAERMAPTDLKVIRDDPKLELYTSPGLAVSHLFVNVGESGGALGHSPELRHALELSLDRNVINQVAFNGEFTADNQMITPSSEYHSDAMPMPERDVEKARELIAQSGVENPTGRDHLRELHHRRPRRPDHPADGGRGRLHRQPAAARDLLGDRALPRRQFRALHRQLVRPRRPGPDAEHLLRQRRQPEPQRLSQRCNGRGPAGGADGARRRGAQDRL